MPRVQREALVRAPLARVFHAVSDAAERRAWLASMAEEPIAGALGVGTRIPARRKAAGSRSRYEITITALDAPRHIASSVKRNGEPVGTGGYDLEAVGDGTRVRAWGEFELSGLQKMMTPVVAAGMEKELDADLAALKKHVESSAGRAP